MFTAKCSANEVKNYEQQIEDDLQLYEKYKNEWIECSFAPALVGSKIVVYPNRFQMRQRVYVENEKCYKRLMVDVDISKIPEKHRSFVQKTQNDLRQAIKDFESGKTSGIWNY